mmetsp:Transcript_30737/g.70330  ORF Transcript_30737/g.70330 Transcript_30737/m.70330 type:complete len:513 (-) Transcript_30737:24-1562(-)
MILSTLSPSVSVLRPRAALTLRYANSNAAISTCRNISHVPYALNSLRLPWRTRWRYIGTNITSTSYSSSVQSCSDENSNFESIAPFRSFKYAGVGGVSAKSDVKNRHREKESAVDWKKHEDDMEKNSGPEERLSKVLARHPLLQLSRRSAEKMIESGAVRVNGSIPTEPGFKVDMSRLTIPDVRHKIVVKIHGKRVHFDPSIFGFSGKGSVNREPRVWLANKIRGELVAESDGPLNFGGDTDGDDRVRNPRLCLLPRLRSSLSEKVAFKPIGRLDFNTEGLMVLTDDGMYARDMERPKSQLWRTYRVRVWGLLTLEKIRAMRRGVTIPRYAWADARDGKKKYNWFDKTYNKKKMKARKGKNDERNNRRIVGQDRIKGMDVRLERRNLESSSKNSKGGGTNAWLRITCTEGKNRQIRRVCEHFGLHVTRLIRLSYGDYDLNTIPTGMAIEVPFKPIETQKRKGHLSVINSTTLPKSRIKSIADLKSKNRKLISPDENQDENFVGENSVEWIRT